MSGWNVKLSFGPLSAAPRLKAAARNPDYYSRAARLVAIVEADAHGPAPLDTITAEFGVADLMAGLKKCLAQSITAFRDHLSDQQYDVISFSCVALRVPPPPLEMAVPFPRTANVDSVEDGLSLLLDLLGVILVTADPCSTESVVLSLTCDRDLPEGAAAVPGDPVANIGQPVLR